MNTRNIQTFLMVSAAFFAMSAPVRSNASTGASAGAISRSALVAPARIAIDRVARESASRKEDQNS
ncbi:hypothetical protein [Burkholderia sp. WSM2230]|uniref:hypothetical protein n=1 Tax=Burkholderia sp. WSM2230 TaxID=944435 RepID=UPI0004010BA3|nr:hypothetical protein [Burkholderia sp. WSM2230]